MHHESKSSIGAPNGKPDSRAAIWSTVGALAELFALFMNLVGDSAEWVRAVLAVAAILLIANAVLQWALFVPAYVAFEIERRLSERGGHGPARDGG